MGRLTGMAIGVLALILVVLVGVWVFRLVKREIPSA